MHSQFDDGGEQSVAKRAFPVFNASVKYESLEATDIQILWNFYQSQQGSAKRFYLFDLVALAHTGLYVNAGDGSTAVFDLPGKSTSARTLYHDGVIQTTGFSYLTGGGVGSADRVSSTVR